MCSARAAEGRGRGAVANEAIDAVAMPAIGSGDKPNVGTKAAELARSELGNDAASSCVSASLVRRGGEYDVVVQPPDRLVSPVDSHAHKEPARPSECAGLMTSGGDADFKLTLAGVG